MMLTYVNMCIAVSGSAEHLETHEPAQLCYHRQRGNTWHTRDTIHSSLPSDLYTFTSESTFVWSLDSHFFLHFTWANSSVMFAAKFSKKSLVEHFPSLTFSPVSNYNLSTISRTSPGRFNHIFQDKIRSGRIWWRILSLDLTNLSVTDLQWFDNKPDQPVHGWPCCHRCNQPATARTMPQSLQCWGCTLLKGSEKLQLAKSASPAEREKHLTEALRVSATMHCCLKSKGDLRYFSCKICCFCCCCCCFGIVMFHAMSIVATYAMALCVSAVQGDCSAPGPAPSMHTVWSGALLSGYRGPVPDCSRQNGTLRN